MVCCTLIAGLFALLGLPLVRLRSAPLEWRLATIASAPSNANAFSLRLKSFGYAFAGLRTLVRDEANARIHCAIASVAIIAGLLFGISAADWRWVVLSIGMVLAAECVNTAVERTCDVASPAFHPLVKAAKDVAAGGVLLTALAAMLIGILTFWPYAIGPHVPGPLPLCSHRGLR
jgi:diacylglycerol kinase